MTIEQAIKTALEYERKVRDSYLQAAKNSQDDTGKRIFKELAKEEQQHVNYKNIHLIRQPPSDIRIISQY